MVVGIVSKPEHCQPHVLMLKKEGFKPVVLGAKGISFPPSLDVIIVRIASSSHGAVDAARQYAAKHNIPLITEDGVSGIKRAFVKSGWLKPSLDMITADVLKAEDNPANFADKLLSLEGADNVDAIVALNRWSEVKGESASGRFIDIFNAVRWVHNLTPEQVRSFVDLFRDANVSQPSDAWKAWKPQLAEFVGAPRKYACVALVACFFAGVTPSRQAVVNGYSIIGGLTMDAKIVTGYRETLGMKFAVQGAISAPPTVVPEPAPVLVPVPEPVVEASPAPEPEPEPAPEPVVEPTPEPVQESTVVNSVLTTVQDEVLNLALRLEELQQQVDSARRDLADKASRAEMHEIDPCITALVSRVTRLEEAAATPPAAVVGSGLEDTLRRLKAMGASITITI
jgi:hypothetical protein